MVVLYDKPSFGNDKFHCAAIDYNSHNFVCTGIHIISGNDKVLRHIMKIQSRGGNS